MNRYDVLGVRVDAAPDDIKKAYRKLAAKTHPDRNGEDMTPLFRSVQDAYETLSDPLKRAAYDRELNKVTAPQAEPAAPAEPAQFYRFEEPEQQYHPADSEAPSQQRAQSGREVKIRRIKIGAIASVFVVLSGYWLFQEIQLWQLVQPKEGVRMLTFQSLPAIVYAVLWTFGTLVATVADDLSTALKTPFGCAAASGGFAFITATGSLDVWIPALVTGIILSFVTGLAIRIREPLAHWIR
ncbi:J domain-containing protein [Arthrobacter terrae]|nr:J domain-containing protein [Arthrobacter terrae]